MRVSDWLRSLADRLTRTRTRVRRGSQRAAFRPRLEQLEDRLTPSGGTLDPTFGTGGVVFNTSVPRYDDVLVQGDGKVIAGGWGRNLVGGRTITNDDFAIARYNPDGTPDTSFGSGGLAPIDFNKASDTLKAVAIQPGSGGKILAAGTTSAITNFYPNTSADFAVVRLNPNGTLDTTFGPKSSKGKVAVDFGGPDVVHSMAVLPDGKFLLAGATQALSSNGTPLARGTLALARFNANGTLDTTFGNGGKVTTNINVVSTPSSMTSHGVNVAVDASGRVVVSATIFEDFPVNDGLMNDFLVTRFTSAGALDTTFGTGGVVTTDIGVGTYDRASALGLQSDGTIVVAGFSEVPYDTVRSAAVVRYDSNGSLMTKTSVSVGPTSWLVPSDLVIQQDGKILLAGHAWDGSNPWQNLLMRLNADGSLDTSYGPQGTGLAVAAFDPTRVALVSAMAAQADGRVILVGILESPNTGYLARYLPSAPQVSAAEATPASAPAGTDVSLAATVSAGNPGTLGAVTQVAFYADSNGDGVFQPSTDTLLGYATHDAASGEWRLTVSTVGWAPGSYRLFARARDGYDVFGDPFAITLTLF